MEANVNIQSLRVLSQVFSPPMFQKIVREDNYSLFEKKVFKYYNTISFSDNLEIIRFLYKSLQKHYRCEYVYKNSLFTDIIRTHGLKDTLTFNEFKVGCSLADLVLLNGSIRIYEIKTELDDLSKLSKQLFDYQKIADKVYIVADENYTTKLVAEYKDSNIGVISLSSNNKLVTIKEASQNHNFFDFDTLFKVLRKHEYLEIVKANYGYVPNVPNTRIFKESYQLLSKIDVIDFQKQVLRKLKERTLSEPKLLKSSKTPKELKHICNSLDFNEEEYLKLYNFLSSTRTCINHI